MTMASDRNRCIECDSRIPAHRDDDEYCSDRCRGNAIKHFNDSYACRDLDQQSTMHIDDLCADLAAQLAMCDPEFVAEIYNKVSAQTKAEYDQDGWFKISRIE
jgi:hypothetical protein